LIAVVVLPTPPFWFAMQIVVGIASVQLPVPYSVQPSQLNSRSASFTKCQLALGPNWRKCKAPDSPWLLRILSGFRFPKGRCRERLLKKHQPAKRIELLTGPPKGRSIGPGDRNHPIPGVKRLATRLPFPTPVPRGTKRFSPSGPTP
jgi:hypothetical protein